MTKTCPVCHEAFQQKRKKKQDVCSRACAMRRVWASRIRGPNTICAECGEPFRGRIRQGERQACCSRSCAVKLLWKRNPEQFAAGSVAGRAAFLSRHRARLLAKIQAFIDALPSEHNVVVVRRAIVDAFKAGRWSNYQRQWKREWREKQEKSADNDWNRPEP